MSKGFEFPPFHDMPPFFTLQPVLNTRKKQIELWNQLILDYAKAHKKYEFDVTEAAKSPLFQNSKINRALKVEDIRTVFEELVQQGYGEWQKGKEKNRIHIYWRRPEEWGALIYKWVSDCGKLNSVMTVWEIQQGEEAEGQEFFELETRILLKALSTLEKEGKAQVFTGNQDDNLGVKFFSV